MSSASPLPLRVAFAIPEMDSAGPDRVIYEVIRGLDRSRVTPILVVTRPGGRYFDALKGQVEHVVTGGGRYPLWQTARVLDRLAPDIVVSTLRMNLTVGAATYLMRRKPVFIARQANAIATDFVGLKRKSVIKHRLAEKVVTRLLARPDILVAQASDMAKELRRYARPGQEVTIIGNPVELHAINAELARQQAAGVEPAFGSPAFVAVGRLAPQKGFDLLLPAFARLRERWPKAGLTILGEGGDRAELEALATRLGLAEAVRMPGRSETVFASVAAADFFVSSSRYEGFSNALLEAMALGTVVVATACEGATREMVLDEETGLLAAETSVDSIADALLRAASLSDDARRDMAARARAHVARHYDQSSVAEAWHDLFVAGVSRQGRRA